MRDWWGWTKWTLQYLVTIVLLLAIYGNVIQTRFECVVFSCLALIYLEIVSERSAWAVEILQERDHRNEIYLGLSEQLGKPLMPEMTGLIKDLSGQTEKMRTYFGINGVALGLLWLVVLWNLLKATF